MANIFELQAEIRQAFGKGASRRLRRQSNKVPAILYGGGEPAAALSFEHHKLTKALSNEAFYSHILTIDVDGKKHKAVLKDLQRHPYKPRVLHMDLQRVTANEKILMQVPLHFMGEESAPGLKQGGIISHQLTSLEIRCLPDNLPEFIEVDLSGLQLDDVVHLSAIKLPKGVEVVAHGTDQIIASIHVPRSSLTEDTVAAATDATPAAATATASTADKAKK